MSDNVRKLLDNALHAFVVTKRRYLLLSETMKEIPRVEKLALDRGLDPARIGNDAVFQMLRDCFDMFVIDLASIRESLVEKQGLLNALKADPSPLRRCAASDFVPRKILVFGDGDDHDTVRQEMDQMEREQIAESINAALQRLVPDEYPVTAKGLESLIKRFMRDTEAVDNDRNHVRAHRYEYRPAGRHRYFQTLEALEAHLKTFEDYLLDLHHVLTHNSYGARLDFASSAEHTAPDLADLIVHGSINRAVTSTESRGRRRAIRHPGTMFAARGRLSRNLAQRTNPAPASHLSEEAGTQRHDHTIEKVG